MPPGTDPQASDEAARISQEIGALHDAAFGARARRMETHMVDDVIVCLIGVPLQPVEETLLETAGGADCIREIRRQFEESVSSSMVAVVEHTTGREVVGFFSDAQLTPPLTVDVFRLAPAA
jgi:uncharacterized protein YbcI